MVCCACPDSFDPAAAPAAGLESRNLGYAADAAKKENATPWKYLASVEMARTTLPSRVPPFFKRVALHPPREPLVGRPSKPIVVPSLRMLVSNGWMSMCLSCSRCRISLCSPSYVWRRALPPTMSQDPSCLGATSVATPAVSHHFG